MKEKYDVSIIVPCYNVEKYVEQTIQSILKQKYDMNKIEVLLINDGSQDNTLKILKKYESENVIVIDKKNEGISKTRNVGIKNARGKYILFLDGDDFLSTNSVKNIVSFFNDHYDEIDLVAYPLVYYYNKRKKVTVYRYKNEYRNGTGIYSLDEYYRVVQSGVNIAIKNDKKHYFDCNKIYGEDEYFNTAILMKKRKIGFVKETSYYYRQHNTSITHKKEEQDFEKHYTFYLEELENYKKHIYIQFLVVHNLQWRINEHCLYPLDIKDKEKYMEQISNRLQSIDLSLFKDDIQESIMLNLIGLQNKKYSIYENDVFIDQKEVLSFHNYNCITRIEIKNNRIKIFGRIETPLFKDNISFYVNHKKVKTYAKEDYQKNVIRYYEQELEMCSKIDFELKDKEQVYELITVPNEWVPKRKRYDRYSIQVEKGITIKRTTFLSRLVNKFRGNKLNKFLIVNLLSVLDFSDKSKVLYYTDKDSEVYKQYEQDTEKKIWLNKHNGLKYKFLILNCKKIVTDKKISDVLPFGHFRHSYLSNSRFNLEVHDKLK